MVPKIGDKVTVFESCGRHQADWASARVCAVETSHILLEFTERKDSCGDPVRRWFERGKIADNEIYVVIVCDSMPQNDSGQRNS